MPTLPRKVLMHSICTGVISNFQFAVLAEFHTVGCLSVMLHAQAGVLLAAACSPVKSIFIGRSCICDASLSRLMM